MDKAKILANVGSMTAEQLFNEIKAGNVSLPELDGTGLLTPPKRKKITAQQTKLDEAEDEAWEQVRYGNELKLIDFINEHRLSKYVPDAKLKIQYLEEARRKAYNAKFEILEKIRNNSNNYIPGDVIEFLNDGTITTDDLLDCSVPEKIITKLLNEVIQPGLELGNPPTSIPEGYTEVYFWGIPGSGKTCALAAILNTAEKNGELELALGPGLNYMTLLKSIFHDDTGNNLAVLPSPTELELTQYLPFILTRHADNSKRRADKLPKSVSLIELSGEIFQCFFSVNAGLDMPSDRHRNTFNSLIGFLKGNNRKIHFFFIDYSKNEKKDLLGYRQSDYLNAASAYFNKPEHGVFGKKTDAIYIVVTKSDLMPCDENQRVEFAKQWLNTNFKAFVNMLKNKCKEHSINGGELTVEPFSLGKVYFDQICDFDNKASQNILDILFSRIDGAKKSFLGVFNK